MQVALGDPVVALLQAPASPPPDYGARIEVPVTRAIVSFWQPADLDLLTNVWTVMLESPVEAGDYVLVWRSGMNEEVPEVFVPLTVTAPGVGDVTGPDGLPVWAPTTDEVAKLLTSYTRGGFDDDDDEVGGAEQGYFDEDTLPSLTQVEGYIATACDEVAGRTGVTVPARCYKLAKAAATWHVAMTVAAGKAPQRADDTDSEVSMFTRNFLASLTELQTQARMGAVRLS